METLTLVEKPAPSRVYNYLVMFAPIILVAYYRLVFSYLLFSPTVMGLLAIYSAVYLGFLAYYDLKLKKSIQSLFLLSLLNYITTIGTMVFLYYYATQHRYSTYVVTTTLILLTFLLMNLRPVNNNEETLRSVKNNKALRMQGFTSAFILESVDYTEPAVSPIDWGFFKRQKFFSYIIGDYYANAQSAPFSFFLIFYFFLFLSLGITTGIGLIQVGYIFIIFFGAFLFAFALRVLYAVKNAQDDILAEIKARMRFKISPSELFKRITTTAVLTMLMGGMLLTYSYNFLFRAPESSVFFDLQKFDLILLTFYILLYISLYLFREFWILLTWRNIPVVEPKKKSSLGTSKVKNTKRNRKKYPKK